MARRAPRKRYSRKAPMEPKGMSQRNKMKVAFAVLITVAVAVLVAIFATPQGSTNGTTAPSTPGPVDPSTAPGPGPAPAPGPGPIPPGPAPFEWWYSRDVMYGTIYPIVIGVSLLLFLVFGAFNKRLYQNKGSEMTLIILVFVGVLTGLIGVVINHLVGARFPYNSVPNPINVDYENHLKAGGYFLAADICILVAIVAAEMFFVMVGFMLFRGKGGKTMTKPEDAKSDTDVSASDNEEASGSDVEDYEGESKGSEPSESQRG